MTLAEGSAVLAALARVAETKADPVRHVRTPEGVQQYNAPIGTPIVSHPDVPKPRWWHGSPSGDMRGGPSGLHIGTQEAARQALNARIGTPVEGEWDGTREYGRTLLAGQRTIKARGGYASGYLAGGPQEDHYPTGTAFYGGLGGEKVPMTARPDLFPVRIKGPMTNTPATAHDDFRANGLMAGQIRRGRAKSGYYYRNVGEDTGSISAVVPGPGHVERLSTPGPPLTPTQEAGLDALRTHPVNVQLGDAFTAAGHSLFLVGGSVRDALAGQPDFADLDYTTDATPEQIKAIVEPLGPIWGVGEAFGTIGAQVQGLKTEITTFRAEKYDETSRKPVVTFGDNLADDLKRRDLTMNASALTIASDGTHPVGSLVDPHNGAADLASGVLRTPDDPLKSMSEDPLRQLRVVRFAAKRNATPDLALKAAVRDLSDRLDIVAPERKTAELQKILAGGPAVTSRAMTMANDLGVSAHLFGGLDTSPATIAVIDRLPADADPTTILATLAAGRLRSGATGPQVGRALVNMKLSNDEIRPALIAAHLSLQLANPNAPSDPVTARGIVRDNPPEALDRGLTLANAMAPLVPRVKSSLSLEDRISVAEQAMERGGEVGDIIAVPQGHLHHPDPEKVAAITPLVEWARAAAVSEGYDGWLNLYANEPLLAKEGGAQAMVTGGTTIVLPNVTNQMTILHEVAHVVTNTEEGSHSDHFVEVAGNLYDHYLGPEAAQTFRGIAGAPDTRIPQSTALQAAVGAVLGNEESAVRAPFPVDGNDLLQLGLQGPEIGAALTRIRAAFLANPQLTRAEALAVATHTPTPNPNPDLDLGDLAKMTIALAAPSAPGDTRPKAVIFDRDGTLASVPKAPTPTVTADGHARPASPGAWAEYNAALPFDRPVPRVVALLRAVPPGVVRIMTSGRAEGDWPGDRRRRFAMQDWIVKHQLPIDELYMRTGGDMRKDSIVKEEILTQEILAKYDVRFAVDDRPQVVEVWDRFGIPTLQVVGPDLGFPIADRADQVKAAAVKEIIAAGLAVVAVDTGRILMLQRALSDDDPAAGKWEFPGGKLDPGEAPLQAALREWGEETGSQLPPGTVTGDWTSPNGIYQGFAYRIAEEAQIDCNMDHEDRHVLNPDDPDGDEIEVVAWWRLEDLPKMPALRTEVRTTDWSVLRAARTETKGLRHVRTPEGVRQYDAPIGTPIVPHPGAHVVHAAARAVTPTSAPTRRRRHPASGDALYAPLSPAFQAKYAAARAQLPDSSDTWFDPEGLKKFDPQWRRMSNGPGPKSLDTEARIRAVGKVIDAEVERRVKATGTIRPLTDAETARVRKERDDIQRPYDERKWPLMTSVSNELFGVDWMDVEEDPPGLGAMLRSTKIAMIINTIHKRNPDLAAMNDKAGKLFDRLVANPANYNRDYAEALDSVLSQLRPMGGRLNARAKIDGRYEGGDIAAGPNSGVIPYQWRHVGPWNTRIARPVNIDRVGLRDYNRLDQQTQKQARVALRKLERGETPINAKERGALVGTYSVKLDNEARMLVYPHVDGTWHIYAFIPHHDYKEAERRMADRPTVGRDRVAAGPGTTLVADPPTTALRTAMAMKKVAEAQDAIAAAARRYPTSWIDRSNAAKGFFIGQSATGRGYYQSRGNPNQPDALYLGNDLTSETVAVHELAHRMERIHQVLTAAEWAFHWRRTAKLQKVSSPTAGEPPSVYPGDRHELKAMRDLALGSNYEADEMSRPDKYMDPYVGKDYGDGPNAMHEVLSMGMEGIWTGSQPMYRDVEHRRLILGLLAAA